MRDKFFGLRSAALGICLAIAASTAAAQAFPSRPIRLIVPNSPGSGLDIVARRIAQVLGANIGQTVLVDDMPGAGGLIGTEAMVRAPKDGYTLALVVSTHVINPYLYKKMPFDAIKDVSPVAFVNFAPMALLARPDLPVNDARGLAAYVAGGAQLTAGSGGNGSISHLLLASLQQAGHFKTMHVPYKGTGGTMIQDLAAGNIDIAFSSPVSVAQLVASGKLKALGMSSADRVSLLPATPAIGDSLPGFDLNTWGVILGPSGIPPATLQRLNDEFNKVMASKEIKSFVESQGGVIDTMPLDALGRFLSTELVKHRELVRLSGATID